MDVSELTTKQIGTFSIDDLKSCPEKITLFLEENHFFILAFDKEDNFIKTNPTIQQMEKKYGYRYIAMVFQKEMIGKENFKKFYHRSTSYVDEKMIKSKEISKLFANQGIGGICFKNMSIKGIKNLCLRQSK